MQDGRAIFGVYNSLKPLSQEKCFRVDESDEIEQNDSKPEMKSWKEELKQKVKIGRYDGAKFWEWGIVKDLESKEKPCRIGNCKQCMGFNAWANLAWMIISIKSSKWP